MSPTITHQRTSLGDVTPNNLGQLRKLNTILFPVNYGEKFYNDVIESGELAKLAYYNDVCVGAVCCRKDNVDGKTTIYMMTLGVLEPYRRLGLGNQLLEHILECAKEMKPAPESVHLHVQTTNDSAVAFYKKYGFEVTDTVKDYYKKIEQRDAYVLTKTI
ncbi:acyl-CoA N-acyltransferase [Phycomyces nitens]|nr:acyl-CoA N-acyltransferase [Phycomyces nitens]